MKQNHQKSWAMAYCGIVAALCVALMLLGAVIPIAMFIAPAVAGFLVATVCVECGMQLALTAYAAVSLLALLFVPDKEVALIFVFLLGYYPLAKPKFERIRPAGKAGGAAAGTKLLRHRPHPLGYPWRAQRCEQPPAFDPACEHCAQWHH